MHHLHLQRITAGVELTFVRSTLYCIQLHCTTLHTTLLHCHTHLIHSLYYTTPHFKKGAGFVPVQAFVQCVCVYEQMFLVFLHARVLFCRGVSQICAFLQIESLYSPCLLSKRQPSFASRSLFVQRKTPLASKAPVGDSFLVVPDRALNDWNATLCTNRFVVFGAADVLSASVFCQRKKFSKAFF